MLVGMPQGQGPEIVYVPLGQPLPTIKGMVPVQALAGEVEAPPAEEGKEEEEEGPQAPAVEDMKRAHAEVRLPRPRPALAAPAER